MLKNKLMDEFDQRESNERWELKIFSNEYTQWDHEWENTNL